jgi:L-threonylcarbamoyladenylate synthase
MTQVTFVELVEAARSGSHRISFPTETVPALAARPDRAALIYAAKQRPDHKPLILMLGEIEQVWDYVTGGAVERQTWQRIMTQYWPGALTLVLPASDRVPLSMNPTESGTIGLRVPNHGLARRMLRATGPLATTSVNRSGQPALLDRAAIATEFPEVLQLSDEALVALQEPIASTSAGQPSTVIQWTQGGWKLLRQGAVVLDAGPEFGNPPGQLPAESPERAAESIE